MMRGNQTTTTTVVAGGVDRSGLVLWMGLILIILNIWFGPNAPLPGLFTGKGIPTPATWLHYVGLFLVLGLLVTAAKFGGEVGGNLAVLFLAAVWIVWLLNEPQAVQKLLQQTPASNSSGAK